jgi:hypothetical protein
MSETVHVDLVRDEILTAGTSIGFTVPDGTDTVELGRKVIVDGAAGSIGPTRGPGQFRWVPPSEMRAGRYRLVIGALTDARSRRLTEPIEIPFTVIDTVAKVPTRLQVQGFGRVRFGEDGRAARLSLGDPPRGNYVEFFKCVDRNSGRPVELAFDQDGAAVDPVAVVDDYRKRLVDRYGKVAPALDRRIREARDGEQILVDVWLPVAEPDPTPGDRPTDDCGDQRHVERAREIRREWIRAAKELADELGGIGEVVAVDQLAPVVTVTLPAGEVRRLASAEAIGVVQLHETEGIDDLGDSIAIARSGFVHAAGESGAGVRVAVWENGPTDDDLLVVVARYRSDPNTSDHSQNVHGIIRNDEVGAHTGTPRGATSSRPTTRRGRR